MKNLIPKESEYFLVFYDFESSVYSNSTAIGSRVPVEINLDELSSENISTLNQKRLHTVNCVSAALYCNECVRTVNINEINAKMPLKHCKNCCENDGTEELRMKTWISGTENCENALEAFMIWMLCGIPRGSRRSIPTYALAHYSGRQVFLEG